MKRNILPDGGNYEFTISNDVSNIQTDVNTQIRLFNDNFTKLHCNKDHLGSGRKIGHECKDFITKDEAKKHKLIFSHKTCFDNIHI